MMFSQYVEDITRNLTEGDSNYRVIPSRFIALDINYKNINSMLVMPNDDTNLNNCIPKYFQNVFENGCAYLRSKSGFEWTPEISKNMFWNCLFNGNFLTTETYDKCEVINEIVYVGDINLHSYNEHTGMGYGEVYCYIPTDGEKMRIHVTYNNDIDRVYDSTNTSKNLLGYKDKYTENYIQNYYYGNDYKLSFDDDNMVKLDNSPVSKYKINTIVVLYDIYIGNKLLYKNIPMGMYVTGLFDGFEVDNTISKYVTTSYGTGTSYGLRICTRFTSTPNGSYVSEIISDDSNYTNLCQLMTGMNENLSKMLDISKSAINTTQQYKDLLSIFKNSKTNVPYVKEINGTDCWFVNGKYIGPVSGNANGECCTELSDETVQKRIDNIMDDNKDNDFDYIKDPNGCDCFPLSNSALAEEIDKIDINFEYEYDGPDYGGGTTGGNGIPGNDCTCGLQIADDKEVLNVLQSNN